MDRRSFLRRAAIAAAAAPLTGVAYARFEAGWVRVTRQRVAVPRLPPPFVGKTVALLTDPHHGPFNGIGLIRAAVEAVNALRPDLVALAGDFVQEGYNHAYAGPSLAELGRLRAPLGALRRARQPRPPRRRRRDPARLHRQRHPRPDQRRRLGRGGRQPAAGRRRR